MITLKSVEGNLPSTRRSLPIALMRAREKVMGPVRVMLAQTAITEQQWRILRVLAEYGPLDSTHLGEHTSLLLPSLTRIIQSMERNRLVSRAIDPNDRRRHVLTITEAGQAIIEDNRGVAIGIATQFVDHLGQERYEALLDTLEALETLEFTVDEG